VTLAEGDGGAVDEDAYFSYALIEKCVDPKLEFWDDRDLMGVASN